MKTLELPIVKSKKQRIIEALDKLEIGQHIPINKKDREQWSHYASIHFNSKGVKTFQTTKNVSKNIKGGAIIWRTK